MTTQKTITLEEMRHSAAHIMALAVQNIFPEVKFGIGPAIADGFYYDFDLPRSLTPEDLVKIEAEMKKLIKENYKFEHFELPRDEAITLMKDKGQIYKIELIEDLNEAVYSFYKSGDFIDLCKGPHIESAKQITNFKLIKVAGAYWRGSEKNKMLQRIYGVAFATKQDLSNYLNKLEEAKKRDHRLIGKELDLFSIHDEIGGGLVLWHPKGARIRSLIEAYWKDEHFKAGYELLYTPHIGKSDLWNTSGHLKVYRENMYSPMSIDEQNFFIKPMNCPFHIMVFKDKYWSYRDLPVRYAEMGTVYRYERSGVLHGLMRVRGFTQDDAHIFCAREQMSSEIKRVLNFSFDILNSFGFKNYEIYLSTRPEEKYVGELSRWEESEQALKAAIEEMGIKYQIDAGGGAFYGPKIDIKIEDAIGRKWQCTTIQFDFNLPELFDMNYVGADGQKHRPYMIHRALLGSLERFFGILIEHYEGKFPVWLAPTQVKILTINDEVHDYASEIKETLSKANFRVAIDSSNEKIGYKIRQASKEKNPYLLILGNKEKNDKVIAVRTRGSNSTSTLTVDEFIKILQEDISLKR